MSNRLSSLSATLSLSNFIDDKSDNFHIHSSIESNKLSTISDPKNAGTLNNTNKSPSLRSSPRLKMQSYFDKENVSQRQKSPLHRKNGARAALSPLQPISNNIQHQCHSVASLKSSNDTKSVNSNNENRKSFISYNSSESSRSLYRRSLDTLGIRRSENTENHGNTQNDKKSETTSVVTESIKTVDEILEPEQIEGHESGLDKFKRTITKSASFISLRNSLSMKSISSNLRQDYPENDERRRSMISKRKMSLENIRSFLKPVKTTTDIIDYKNNISLPVMQQQTKEKIRRRLRNSSSVVSISSFASEPEHNGKLKSVDINQLHQSLLLKLCSQSRVVSFTSYLNKFQSSNTMKHLARSYKSKNSYLLLEFSHSGDYSDSTIKPSGIWKVIPIHRDTTTRTIQELTLTMMMSNKEGFVKINSAKLVKGPCPQSVLQLMEEEQNKNQVYLIMRLNYGGTTLKDYKLKSWKDASIIFSQILDAISNGEELGYEHRDLNIENILIDETENPDNSTSLGVIIIDHALARSVVNGQVMYTNLYDPEFFKGSGEYRHTIYRFMRRIVNNCTNNIPESFSTMSIKTLSTTETQFTDMQPSEWANSYPVFNLLWVHYLLHILLFEKGLKPIKMNPILKKKGWLANGGEVGEENAIYEKLLQGYRMVQPAVIFGDKKNKYIMEVNNVREFRDWFNQ